MHNDLDLVTIEAPDFNGTRRFVQPRIVLANSPVFQAFFDSEHYLRGVLFTITLAKELAPCVGIALQVLHEMGNFRLDDLQDLLSQYDHRHLVVITTRLHYLAVHLQVGILQNIARDLLIDMQHTLTAIDCVVIASIVYKDGEVPDDSLRLWVLDAIQQHMTELILDDNWKAVVHTSSPILAADLYNIIANDYTITRREAHPAIDVSTSDSIAVSPHVEETAEKAAKVLGMGQPSGGADPEVSPVKERRGLRAFFKK